MNGRFYSHSWFKAEITIQFSPVLSLVPVPAALKTAHCPFYAWSDATRTTPQRGSYSHFTEQKAQAQAGFVELPWLNTPSERQAFVPQFYWGILEKGRLHRWEVCTVKTDACMYCEMTCTIEWTHPSAHSHFAGGSIKDTYCLSAQGLEFNVQHFNKSALS